MSGLTIGFAGMTHLGLVSATAAAAKGFSVVCFDPEVELAAALAAGRMPVAEPQLDELATTHRSRMLFTSRAEDLASCDLVYVAPDVPTDDLGSSDLSSIDGLLETVTKVPRPDSVVVILSQVPPGYTRSRRRPGRSFFYQVETLIFGQAVERAMQPERYIVGCEDPDQALPRPYAQFLAVDRCPVLPMRYESAELAKISINMCLVASISTANTLAELCESIGADWSEIVPALRLDRRIGQYAYLAPGLGIAGGNLERDLATVCSLADRHGTDAGVVRAWIANSRRRRAWAARTARAALLDARPEAEIAIWGLAYKENTRSVKNSPALATIAALPDARLRLHDPLVDAAVAGRPTARACESPMEAIAGADALMILTPWPQYREVSPTDIARAMRGTLVIDPYGVLDRRVAQAAGLEVRSLGAAPPKAGKNC